MLEVSLMQQCAWAKIPGVIGGNNPRAGELRFLTRGTGAVNATIPRDECQYD